MLKHDTLICINLFIKVFLIKSYFYYKFQIYVSNKRKMYQTDKNTYQIKTKIYQIKVNVSKPPDYGGFIFWLIK